VRTCCDCYLVLTDRGTEFSDPTALETDGQGLPSTRIFYCEPNRSDQKGHCENNHEQIRCVIPKGTSFSSIGLDQRKVHLMFFHIGSKKRQSLGGRSPFEVFSFLFGQGILGKLGLREIPATEVLLKPSLLK
jgi:IS30 family transposase